MLSPLLWKLQFPPTAECLGPHSCPPLLLKSQFSFAVKALSSLFQLTQFLISQFHSDVFLIFYLSIVVNCSNFFTTFWTLGLRLYSWSPTLPHVIQMSVSTIVPVIFISFNSEQTDRYDIKYYREMLT